MIIVRYIIHFIMLKNFVIIYFAGGWITTSNISTTIEANKRSLPVLCHGMNMQLAENVVSTHTVNILREYHKLFHSFQFYLSISLSRYRTWSCCRKCYPDFPHPHLRANLFAGVVECLVDGNQHEHWTAVSPEASFC